MQPEPEATKGWTEGGIDCICGRQVKIGSGDAPDHLSQSPTHQRPLGTPSGLSGTRRHVTGMSNNN